MKHIGDALFEGHSPCKDFTIYKQKSFHPIHSIKWQEYFNNGTDSKKILEEWKKLNVLGAHVWNELSAEKPVFKGAGQLYEELAREYCPRVYAIAPEKF